MPMQLAVLNPHRRGSRKRHASTPHRKRRTHHKRRNPIFFNQSHRKHHRRRHRSNPVSLPLRAVTRNVHHRRHRVHHRRHRRNPELTMTTGSVTRFITDAAVGAVGAVGIDIGMGYAGPYLPAAVMNPLGYAATKSAAAILIGVFGKRLPLVGPWAVKAAHGSLICTFRDTIRSYVPQGWPLGYVSAGYVPAGTGVQAYIGATRTGGGLLGRPNPTRTGRGLLGYTTQMEREVMMGGPSYTALQAYVNR